MIFYVLGHGAYVFFIFQLNDCHQGVVFDSLETLFSTNYQSTLLAVLKAINNRKHIYFVSQKLDYGLLKARQKAKEEEKGIL